MCVCVCLQRENEDEINSQDLVIDQGPILIVLIKELIHCYCFHIAGQSRTRGMASCFEASAT